VTAPGACRAVGADRTVEVTVKNSVEFLACLRGPNLARNERRVEALLESTQFPQSGSGTSS
jgi:ABC-type multidrug transport system ATPase subunit